MSLHMDFFFEAIPKKMLAQRMGDLPTTIFDVPCRPFTHISLDFYGPHMVSSMTGSRTKLKTFTLILVCLNTGAANLVLCAGYSTKEFLIAFRMHCADFGFPRFVYSDPGSQWNGEPALLSPSGGMPTLRSWSRL